MEGEPASSVSDPRTGCTSAGLDALILAACGSAEAPLQTGSDGFTLPLSLLSNSAANTACCSFSGCGASAQHVPMDVEGVTTAEGLSAGAVLHEDGERETPVGGEGTRPFPTQGGSSDVPADREEIEDAVCGAVEAPPTGSRICFCNPDLPADSNQEVEQAWSIEELKEKLALVTPPDIETEGNKEKESIKEKEKGKDTMKKLVSLASAGGWEGGPIGECLDLSFDDVMTHRILSGKERGKWRPEKTTEKELKASLLLNPTPQVVWPVASSDCPTPTAETIGAVSANDGAAEGDREDEGESSLDRVVDPGSSFRKGDDADDQQHAEGVHIVSLPPSVLREEEQETGSVSDEETHQVPPEANPWEWDFLSNMIDKDILTDKVNFQCPMLCCCLLSVPSLIIRLLSV